MKKIVRLTESDLIRLVNKVINEQNDLSSKGFQKWGTGGYLMRLPKGSNNTNDAIRIKADLEGDKYNVIVSVQSNKKVRAEIKGNNVFKKIESILGDKFSTGYKGEWQNTSGVVDSNTLDEIVNLLSSLKVDEKNNIFTESDLIRLVKKVVSEQKQSFMIDTDSVYRPEQGYGGNNRETVRGSVVWLNSEGSKDWPQGDVQKAASSAKKLLQGVEGADVSGEGEKLIQQVVQDWKEMDLVTQNEFLKQWYLLTRNKKAFSMGRGNYTDYGTPWDALDEDYENNSKVQMIKDSVSKVKTFCKSYVDAKNKGQNPQNNEVCNQFVTDRLTAPGWDR